jgi:hypothetical protein
MRLGRRLANSSSRNSRQVTQVAQVVRKLQQMTALVPYLLVTLGLWPGGGLRWRSASGIKWSACWGVPGG